ncbi:MAG: hypothetical protein RXR03_09010 [Thermocladium sp.]
MITQPELARELEQEMMLIKNDLENSVETQNYEVIDEFLNDALDLIYYVDAGTMDVVGFDIGVTVGGPNINLEYSRGRCELIGAWGGAHLTMNVNNAVCEEILERVEEQAF